MKLNIDGIEDDYQIIQARRGCFTCEPESGLVWFHEFFIAMGKQDKNGFSDIALSPLCRNDRGDVLEICKEMAPYTEIGKDLLVDIIEGCARSYCMSISEAAERVIFDFLQHDTPFTLDAAEYAFRVLPKNSLTFQYLSKKLGL